jgi:hypothetical protein
MKSTSKQTLATDLVTLKTGLTANLTAGETIILGGATYTVPQLTAAIDGFLAEQAKTVTAKNAYTVAVANEKASNASARALRSLLQGYASTRYGKDNPILSQFGFPPANPKKPSTAVKAVAVLKNKATRADRGTTGKAAKAKIKGSVDPSILATLTGEAPPAPAAGGAPNGGTQSALATAAHAGPTGEVQGK